AGRIRARRGGAPAAEVVVERMVLLHDQHQVLDRRASTAAGGDRGGDGRSPAPREDDRRHHRATHGDYLPSSTGGGEPGKEVETSRLDTDHDGGRYLEQPVEATRVFGPLSW